jgi:hypothetical protein
LKSFAWDATNDIAGRGSIMVKDPYNPALGNEDLWGMLARFWGNSEQYFSSGLFNILGFEVKENSTLLTCLVYAISIFSLYFSLKENKYISFIIILTGIFIAVTFFVVAVFWNQSRVIVPVYPFILISIFTFLYYLLKKAPQSQFIYPIIIVVMLFAGLETTFKTIPQVRKLKNQYSGLTPDWINYFKMSEWAAENIGKDTAIACRKGSMSFVYGGRPFVGIAGVPSVVTDSALKKSNFKNHFIGSKQNGLPQQIYYSIIPFMTSIVLYNNSILFVYDLPDSTYNDFVRYANSANIPYYANPEEMLQDVIKSESHYAAYPDSLLMNIKRRNVGYIIDASLRSYPNMKTGNVISTISRYMYFIQVKYPDIFTKEHQIGLDDFEPAYIYKIHYPPNIK